MNGFPVIFDNLKDLQTAATKSLYPHLAITPSSFVIIARKDYLRTLLTTQGNLVLRKRYNDGEITEEFQKDIEEIFSNFPDVKIDRIVGDLHFVDLVVDLFKKLGVGAVDVAHFDGSFTRKQVNHFVQQVETQTLELDCQNIADSIFQQKTYLKIQTRAKIRIINKPADVNLDDLLIYPNIEVQGTSFPSWRLNGLMNSWKAGNLKRLRSFKIVDSAIKFNLRELFYGVGTEFSLRNRDYDSNTWWKIVSKRKTIAHICVSEDKRTFSMESDGFVPGQIFDIID